MILLIFNNGEVILVCNVNVFGFMRKDLFFECFEVFKELDMIDV